MKENEALSPVGVRSGTSGKLSPIQECISAKLKGPVSFKTFIGL